MISRQSRYRATGSYASRDPARSEAPIIGLKARTAGTAVTARYHQVSDGERVDHLAVRYYGDPLKFWLICDANDAIFPDELMVPGRVLRIPVDET